MKTSDQENQSAGVKRINRASESGITDEINDDGPPSKLFKLNHDCFEHVFEWLSLNELLVNRLTCKQLKQMIDLYLKLNYPKVINYGVYTYRHLSALGEARLECYRWIKHLKVSRLELTNTAIESIKYILDQVESLELDFVKIDGEFYEAVLQHCPKLKRLTIETNSMSESMIGTGHEWLSRQYPILNYLNISTDRTYSKQDESFVCPQLFIFLVQNPNIQSFAIDSNLFTDNRLNMMGSNIKIDRLDIYVERCLYGKHVSNMERIRDLANDLFAEGFFKRLHLYTLFHRNCISNVSGFGKIEKLHVNSLAETFVMPVVESIKELSVQTLGHFSSEQLAMTASNLVNLKQFEIKWAELRDIKPFICHSPKLKNILVWRFYCWDELNIDDFIALDDERSCLGFAEKVTIFMDAKCYLKLKWQAKKIDFDFIELKSIDTCKVHRLFY